MPESRCRVGSAHNSRGNEQRPRRAPRKAADIVAGLLARRGYGRVQAGSRAQAAWADAVGPKMAAHSRPGSVRRGVLDVVVRNSAAIQELTFQKKSLLKKLNQSLPEENITGLKFRVGPVDVDGERET